MSGKNIEFNLQLETQKAIAALQQYTGQLDQAIQMVDANMRQAYSILLNDNGRLTLRVNFLLNELKTGMTKEQEKELEERFKVFILAETEKMNKEMASAIKAREKAEETEKKESNIVLP